MTTQKETIHFEQLINRCVFNVDGKKVGRIEEAVADRDGVVNEFHVGSAAAFERFASSIVSVLGVTMKTKGYVVAWDRIDFSDPKKPRLLCDLSELQPLE